LTHATEPGAVHAHPLAATASLAWNADLPRQLERILVDTAMAAYFGDR